MIPRALSGVLLCVAVAAIAQEKPLGGAPKFMEHLIADKYGYAYGLAAADLDGDGDLDLTSCDTRGHALYWFENNGKGNFQRHFIQQDEQGWFERHAVGDVNGDKLPDVVVVKNLHGHLVWFENSGQPAKDKQWKRHVISTDFKRAYDVALVDLNGDGRLDVAGSAWNGNHIAWFANPGPAGAGQEWKKLMIDPQLAEARTMRVADFNGDKKPDILSTGRLANLTAWYEQPGAADQPWKRHVIDERSPQPVHGQPVDMDGDGDADVLMALGMLATEGQADTNQIVWYENVGKPGKGDVWKKHLIGALPFAFEAVAADLDGDRDLDIVATAWGGAGQIVWFERTADPQAPWKQHVLKSKWPRANQPIVADMDGDGRPDIIATAEIGANELRWWRNAGVAPVEPKEENAFDTSQVTVQRIVRAAKLPQAKGEPGVVIVLHNPQTFYIGGLYWVLWAGGKPYAEGTCDLAKLDKQHAGENKTRCFTLSAAAWEKLPQGAPLFLTWGESAPQGDSLPLAKLDKKKIEDADRRR